MSDNADLLSLELRSEADVFTARQLGRAAAAAVGLDYQDQVRVAAALSEAGRECLSRGAATTAVVRLGDDRLELVLRQRGLTTRATGIIAAARLMDGTELDEEDIILFKALPRLPRARLRELREHLAGLVRSSPLDELRAQNQELLAALEDVQRTNLELEETNHGVMALYTQLSEELERTNQGVVALYAELEDKSAQLREASEAKSRFLANVSHELRAPATSILGLTRLMGGGREVELVRSSANDLLGLVNELLDLAKAESGRLEPHPADVDVRLMLARLDGLLRPLAPEGVELVMDDPDSLDLLHADPEMMTHVLRNLLTNGLKFTRSGTVRLSARAEGDVAVLTVADTGVGIPDDQLGRIFEEFYQVKGDHQTGVRGTGLGLPYAKKLVEIQGGTLGVRSRLGEGTTFEVRLPHPYTLRLDRVLIADDDPAYRRVVRSLIEESAEVIHEAEDGLQGLELARREQYDAILLDVFMPGMDGLEVLRELRAEERTRTVPVVLITSAELTREPEGANAVLAKATLTRGQLLRALAGVENE
ncbi:ATP-binding response regulator [Nonomuraea soli]|uniref:histidine kinase n=1 Tax=Nonomuraea soli TaxID=1032476 RepID=A0A7W0CDY2_9ACTN|nr:ATP-binding protein [Nonomuraea soli]MBA2889220.1 signal transduction histidine kinase [Nonomuraea soli]